MVKGFIINKNAMSVRPMVFGSSEKFTLASIHDGARYIAILESASHRVVFFIPRLMHLPLELQGMELEVLGLEERRAFEEHLVIPQENIPKVGRSPFLGILLLILSLFFSCGCHERNLHQDYSDGVEIDNPPILDCIADTLSGFYADFDFLTLRGMCIIDSNARKFPYTEVRFHHDSITVKKWFGPTHPNIFEIRRIGKNGMWVEIQQEPHIKEDSWLKIYVTNPEHLTLLKYRGNTSSPHEWTLYRAEAIYPGPVVISKLLNGKPNKHWHPSDFLDQRNFFYSSITKFAYSESHVFEEYTNLKGSYGKDSRRTSHKLHDYAKNIPRSILWIYFDLARISRKE